MMKLEISVFLLGFAPFEKSAFESFFKLEARRDLRYKILADITKAQAVLVNSDNPSAVQWVADSVVAPQKVLFIGAPDPAGKWPAVPKPIKLETMLALLDVLVLAGKQVQGIIERNAEEEIVSASAAATPPDTNLPARVIGSVRQGTGKRGVSDFGLSSFIGLGKGAAVSQAGQNFDHILIVDEDDSALQFMQKRLNRYGFHAELAKTSMEALVRISTGKYKFVFLEVVLPGMDGYEVCRDIKQSKHASGKPPVVVMFSSRGGSADKIRGGLAGCDAYLTKPLVEAELLKVLSKYDDQVERSFRRTNVGGSGTG